MRSLYILIAILALPPMGRCGPLPNGGVSGAEVAAALKQAGYPADLIAERSGNPLIRSSNGKALFSIHFFQCNAELRCASIQFTMAPHRGFVAPATIASWNRDRRFGRAFLDSRGTAWIAMDVETSRGTTTEALGANIERWISVITAFELFAGR